MMGGRTGGEHTVQVLDRAEVDEEPAGDLAQVLHLLWRGCHNGRRAERERRVRGLGRHNIVRDLS